MLISSITLNNIRSYTHQKIDFQEGINVLYGNIGSGKSTILLAIEVALFGLKKGDGHHILRKGCEDGSIEVTFQEEDSIFTISRTFKKTKTGITQSKGVLKTNLDTLELSTQEMNMHIFTYFNFPISFLNKDKTLMYRFTHYTPQEQLKEILLTQADRRLEVLRKVFNIDKYKQLQQALQLTSKTLSKEITILETKLQELPQNLEEEIEIKQKKIQLFQTDIKEIESKEMSLKHKLELIVKNKRILEDKRATILEHVKQVEQLKIQEKRIIKEIELSKKHLEEHKNTFLTLESQKKQVTIQKEKKEQLTQTLQSLELSIEKILKQCREEEKKLFELEKQQFEFEKFKTQIKKLNDLQMNYIQIQTQLKDVKVSLQKHNSLSKKEEKLNTELQVNTKELNEFQATILQKQQSLREIKKLQTQIETIKEAPNLELVNKNKEFLTCPMCFQTIDKTHKEHIHSIVTQKSQELEELEKSSKKQELLKQQEILETKLQTLQISKNQLLKIETQIESYSTQLHALSKQLELQQKEFENIYPNKEQVEYYKQQLLEESQININKVTDEHKNSITEKQKITQKLQNFQLELKTFEEQQHSLKKELGQIEKSGSQLQELELKIVSHTSKIEELDNNIKLFEEQYTSTQNSLQKLSSQIILNSKIDEKISQQKELEQKCNEKLEQIYEQKSKFKTSQEYESKELLHLEKQLKKKKQILNNLKTQNLQQSFVKEDMIEICRIVEETLFIEIHTELSRKIIHYFKQLIEEQDIEVYIREDFSIIIEQNGYEVDVEQLSGGEKSALALSYRLSLKEVIEAHFKDQNNLDYIILDEPTDGFSQNQIQKFAQILRQSNFKQIFLVSHDSNLLTSGEHTYTIEKENHISNIMQEN
ncbi:MAG: hypothetical protein ACMXYB_03915 [Candidatus Woesearchaeota archaeon]